MFPLTRQVIYPYRLFWCRFLEIFAIETSSFSQMCHAIKRHFVVSLSRWPRPSEQFHMDLFSFWSSKHSDYSWTTDELTKLADVPAQWRRTQSAASRLSWVSHTRVDAYLPTRLIFVGVSSFLTLSPNVLPICHFSQNRSNCSASGCWAKCVVLPGNRTYRRSLPDLLLTLHTLLLKMDEKCLEKKKYASKSASTQCETCGLGLTSGSGRVAGPPASFCPPSSSLWGSQHTNTL